MTGRGCLFGFGERDEFARNSPMNAAPTGRLDERYTQRLLLRRAVAEDFDDLAQMRRDPRVMATLGGVRSASETALRLEELIDHWRRHGFGRWIARWPLNGEFVGYAGLEWETLDGRPEVEVGYALVPHFWGRGLATELVHECLLVAFSLLDRPDLVAFTLPTNLASRRVLEKTGFRFEREGIHEGLPHVFYRIERKQWRAPQVTHVDVHE
jgi:ribosomal-protein-alanine N-acetyltransferase